MDNTILFYKGTRDKMPSEKDDDAIYVTIENTDSSYASLYTSGREFVSKEYIDNLVGDIERLINEL